MTDPSAALFFSTSITTRPPAPERFSTMVEDAYAFICSARSLAMTSLGPPAGKPTMMRAVECNGCARLGESPRAYDAMPPAFPNKKRRRLGLITRRTSVIANPLLCFLDALHSNRDGQSRRVTSAYPPRAALSNPLVRPPSSALGDARTPLLHSSGT